MFQMVRQDLEIIFFFSIVVVIVVELFVIVIMLVGFVSLWLDLTRLDSAWIWLSLFWFRVRMFQFQSARFVKLFT